MTIVINNDNFEGVIAEGVTLVDFWAEWCGPCQMMGPIVEQLAEKMGNRAKVAKVNVDENPKIAKEYRIMSIPTILIFKNSEVVETIVGVQDLAMLEEAIGTHL